MSNPADEDPDTRADTPPPTEPEPSVAPCADQTVTSVPASIVGRTGGNGDQTPVTCDENPAVAADDYTVAFVAPAAGTYAFTTLQSTSDPRLLLSDGCGGPELGCSDERDLKGLVTVDLAAGQVGVVVLDGGDAFVLDIFEVQPSEVDCTNGLDDDVDRQPDCLDADCDGDLACVPTCPDVLATGGRATTSTVGRTDDYTPKCNVRYVSGPTSDTSVAFTVPADGRYGVQVIGHAFDPTLALLDGCDGLELGCSLGDTLVVDRVAGQTVVAVVDGWYPSPEGAFDVAFFPVESNETSCSDGLDNDVTAGADCFDPTCATDPACTEDCGNGVDDDGDTLVDCADAGCDGPCVETSCTGGVDDDGNGLVDCADPDCDLDPGCGEDCENERDDDHDEALDCLDRACTGDPACVAVCPADALDGFGTIEGRTIGRPDAVTPSCRVGSGATSDWSVAFTAPADGRYVFDTVGSVASGTLVVLDQCGGPELGCDDPPYGSDARVVVELVADQTVVAVIDAYTHVGRFDLNVAEVPREEDTCGDGLDADADGHTDCADPDCALDQGCTEDCADGTDNNLNGDIDCTDPVCGDAAACESSCPEILLEGPVLTKLEGSTVGLGSDEVSTCGNGAPGADRTFGFVAPETGIYTFDTIGSRIDTVLSVLDGCGGASLACNDDLPGAGTVSQVEVPLVAGQAVIVVVDGYDEDGDYILSVR